MGGKCSTNGKKIGAHRVLVEETLNEEDKLEDPCLDGNVKKNRFSGSFMEAYIALIWVRIDTRGMLL